MPSSLLCDVAAIYGHCVSRNERGGIGTNQVLGLFLPTLAGWLHDRYDPRWLRPGALSMIALGFVLVGLFAGKMPVWGLPLMLLPVGIGSNLFNTANNAVVMNTLEEDRGFASGMLETTRQMGHTIGTTISAKILGLPLLGKRDSGF